MRPLLLAMTLGSSLLTGCSYLGYYKRVEAVRAPPSVEEVEFPNDYEAGPRLDGRTSAALAVAMNDFLPPGAKVRYHDEKVARCLSSWDTYDTSILKASDDLFFIRFTPQLSRCGVDTTIHVILDAGAEYAIDGQGRILASH
ncbi:hypothetical protein P2318_34405 [Myxococcaceae bacterium GXIMD 01537]